MVRGRLVPVAIFLTVVEVRIALVRVVLLVIFLEIVTGAILIAVCVLIGLVVRAVPSTASLVNRRPRAFVRLAPVVRGLVLERGR